ncbi:MAG TPA: glycosyltransferase, partial [Gemmatimonadales bacterium]|nr:glycosyltransferase [Gemmatimonadales bacterium]
MIVGKVWDSEYPWDVRVEKVGKAITEAGHRVVLACRNRRRAELTEQREEAEVHRMPPLERVPALEGLSSFPAFVNPRWYRHLSRTFSAQRVDLVLCRDLPLGPLALAVARRLGVPFFIDIAEHYPGLLKDLYNRRDFRVTNLLVRNPVLAAGVERWLLPRADGVWVVVDEMAERLARMGVARDRITLVSNTPL